MVGENGDPIITTRSGLNSAASTKPLCVDIDSVGGNIADEISWITTVPLTDAQRSFYKFPLDTIRLSVYVELLLDQRNDQGPVEEGIDLPIPTQSITVSMPGWRPQPHEDRAWLELSRPFWQVQIANFALVGLMLVLIPFLWTLTRTEDFLAATIALVLAFWTARQFIIGDQPVGGLLFDQLFILGQFGILVSIITFLLKRMVHRRTSVS